MQRPRRESLLATLMFTDIVGSSEIVAELGDRRWRILLSHHHAVVRRQLRRFGGHEIDTAGDGFFARFENPGNAIRCAAAIVEAVHEIGLDVRIGLHLGQAEIVGKKLGGAAVHIGARVMSLAGPAQVLVTGVLRDVLPSPDFTFEDRGSQVLKGVAGEWHLYRVTAVDQPLPGPLDPGLARERRAAVQTPPMWRRRYVPVAAVAVVVAAGAVGTALLIGRSPARPSATPSQTATGLPAHALLRLDPETGSVVAAVTIEDPLPPPPNPPGGNRASGPGPRSIAVGEGSIWVTNGGSDSVLRVDPITGRTKSIDVARRPVDVTVGQGGVWVISADGYLTRIDPGTEETRTIEIQVGESSVSVAADDRRSLYVTGQACLLFCPPGSAGTLTKVDASRESVTTIPVPRHGPNPESSVIALDESLWLAAGSEVWRVDPDTGKVLAHVRIEGLIGELVAGSDGSSVWVSAARSGRQVGWAIQIDASSGKILSQQPIGCCPGAIAVGNGYVWVTNSRDGNVERISEVTEDVQPPIPVAPGVNAIVIGQGGVWVTVDRP
jgi:class 3 adenylate cyclase/streptogramin lyase